MLKIADPHRFRSLMGRFVTGVSVIAVSHAAQPGQVVAMTANSLTSVSLDPLLLLFCVRNESRLLPHLQASRAFSVNVLASHQDSISRYYAGQPSQGSEGIWEFTTSAAPALVDANASFFCSTQAWHAHGDHQVVIGEVTDMVSSDPPAPALIYASGKYMGVNLHHA
ncbi:flavin reductase family protein [Variovorax terrae]|uniref:Flavin reductase family protein n=1 Tax=Variovorax terrae TaxID=2923278 RepID=A0A9X2AQL8_9BURK|nr:flavin reductase family protein [Variovorax terrae]MCJ0766160.1 flavin reductase family protein [Variovorax terrae]